MQKVRHVAIYVRVSGKSQDHRSQLLDLKAWAERNQEKTIRWYSDTFSGRTMDRPEWNLLDEQIESGQVSELVVWRLDRLGRTAKGLTALFDRLIEKKTILISIRDCIDISTASGRLMMNVLASVSNYETEVRNERVRAGQMAAKAAGKTWGGSEKGRRLFISKEQQNQIIELRDKGTAIASIARACGVSRPTVYAILKQQETTGR